MIVSEVRCSTCGYGAIINGTPPPCPMCQTRSWTVQTRTAPRVIGEDDVRVEHESVEE